MRELGWLLVICGVISIVLRVMRMGNHLFLLWVDQWGPATGWAIRIGLVALGVALIAVTYRKK